MTLVWERAPYTAGSLLVLLALADWSNDDGISWPSMDRLARKARIDRRSAQRIVRQLAKDGVLVIDEGGGRGKQHRYLIQVETVANCRPLAEVETATQVSPLSDEKGDISDTKRATFDVQRATFQAETVTPTSPDPLVEPLEKPSVDPLETREQKFWWELKTNPAYRHVDLEVECGRMRAWLALPKNKSRKMTPAFVLNWLNKIDPPLNGNGHAKADVAPAPVEPKTADWYINSYKTGLKVAPRYDFLKDIFAIPDKAVKEEVLHWWMRGRTQDEIDGANTISSQQVAL